MSKGKERPTRKKFNIRKLFSVFIVVIFLSTFILAIVSWIISGEALILSAIVDLLTKVLEFAVAFIALYQRNYL